MHGRDYGGYNDAEPPEERHGDIGVRGFREGRRKLKSKRHFHCSGGEAEVADGNDCVAHERMAVSAPEFVVPGPEEYQTEVLTYSAPEQGAHDRRDDVDPVHQPL